jgi:hypothetical protein
MVFIRSSSQSEFHRHFHQHVHRHATTLSRRKAPLPYRRHRAFVEAIPQSIDDLDVANGPILSDDDLQNDFTFDVSLPSLLRVVGLDLPDETGWGDAAAGTVWTAAGAAARPRADTGAFAFAESRASA